MKLNGLDLYLKAFKDDISFLMLLYKGFQQSLSLVTIKLIHHHNKRKSIEQELTKFLQNSSQYLLYCTVQHNFVIIFILENLLHTTQWARTVFFVVQLYCTVKICIFGARDHRLQHCSYIKNTLFNRFFVGILRNKTI